MAEQVRGARTDTSALPGGIGDRDIADHPAPQAGGAAPTPVADEGWPAWWADPYWILAAAAVLFLVAVSLRHPWNWDFGVHAGTVERLAADFFHPGNPMVDDPASTIYYSPYSLLAGAFAWLTGLSGRTVLGIVAPLAMVLFLVGLRRFVETLTRSRWAPTLVLVCVLLLWGTKPLDWSGFPSLFGVPLIASYPSFVALGATLLWWAQLHRALNRPASAVGFALLGLLGAAIALTHPFTAVTAAYGAIGIVAHRARLIDRSHWLGLAGAAAGALVLVAVWPYYSFFSLAGTRAFDAIHWQLYTFALGFFGLSVVTLPALWVRFRRDRLDPLVVLFVLGLATVVVGWATGALALGRAWPAALLAGQIALGVELTSMRGRLRKVWVPVLGLTLVVALWFQCGNLAYGLPGGWVPRNVRVALKTTPPGPDFAWLRQHTRRGDVVLTDQYGWLMALPGFGLRTVVPAWPDPFLIDVEARNADQRRIVDPATPAAERRTLLDRYHVRWVITPWNGSWRADAWGMADVRHVATGPGGQLLYGVSRTA